MIDLYIKQGLNIRNKALKGCGSNDGDGGGSGGDSGNDGSSGNNHNAMDTSWVIKK